MEPHGAAWSRPIRLNHLIVNGLCDPPASRCENGAGSSNGPNRTPTPAQNAGIPGVPATGGAESGAVSTTGTRLDPDLARLIRAWGTLPAATRRAILEKLDTSNTEASP
jgi:hypothetical protein